MVRTGLVTLLRRLPGLKFALTEVADPLRLEKELKLHRPDLLIVNPAVLGYFSLPVLKESCDCQRMKCIALLCSPADRFLLKAYDEVVSVHDSEDQIRHKLSHCTETLEEADPPGNDDAQCLSSREKEIVICVVKGLTNKEIAEKLYLSAHTVITHRRNIAKKLQIHSASGLTIYAIVNKLVSLEDIERA